MSAVRQCRYCGKLFIADPPMLRYCSDTCRRLGRNRLNRKYKRQKKKIADYNDMLSNTEIIMVNGQPRVKAAVILEKLIEKGKVNAKKRP